MTPSQFSKSESFRTLALQNGRAKSFAEILYFQPLSKDPELHTRLKTSGKKKHEEHKTLQVAIDEESSTKTLVKQMRRISINSLGEKVEITMLSKEEVEVLKNPTRSV